MKIHALFLTGLLVTLGTQAACNKPAPDAAAGDAGGTSATAAAMDAGGKGAAASADADKQKAADAALDGMVDCLNHLDGAIHEDIGLYVRRLPPEKKDGTQPGPTGKESDGYMAEPNKNYVKECHAGLDLAAKDATYKDVVEKYRASIDKLVPVMQEAYTYYDQKNYKDDKFAKGKELHERMWPMVEDFRAQSKAFRAMVVKANDARSVAELAEVEKTEGRKLTFQKLNLMSAAKNAVRVGADDKATLADLEAVFAAYDKAQSEEVAYVAANPKSIDGKLGWSGFTRAADDFSKALKERVRRVRDKTKYESYQLDKVNDGSVEGSPGKVTKAFNELVRTSNES